MSGAGTADPYHIRSHAGAATRQPATEHGERSEPSKRIIVGFGFWVFLLSDIVMFSAFFAGYAVLQGARDGGPGPRDLFDITSAAWETAALLLSSFACGLATIALEIRKLPWFLGAMALTFVFGAVFLGLELHEFAGLVARHAGPSRSAFLSSFFALVGCHGLHVTCGMLWLLTMMAQVTAKGFREDIKRRVMCFSLFWHALDIIWVGVFTMVYLLGLAR